MQFSIGRDFKINLGGGTYEMANVSAHWVVNHRDLGYSDAEWAAHVDEVGPYAASKEIAGIARDLLVRELRTDIEAHEPYIVEPEKSFVPLWLEDHEEPEKKKRGS